MAAGRDGNAAAVDSPGTCADRQMAEGRADGVRKPRDGSPLLGVVGRRWSDHTRRRGSIRD